MQQRYEGPRIPRPTTTKDWLAAVKWALLWTITSARLPDSNPRRRYARSTLTLGVTLGMAVGGGIAALIYLTAAH